MVGAAGFEPTTPSPPDAFKLRKFKGLDFGTVAKLLQLPL